jgi:hypothetical protein
MKIVSFLEVGVWQESVDGPTHALFSRSFVAYSVGQAAATAG